MNDNQSNLFVYYGAIPGSPAANSDLKIGDKIISVNGLPLLKLEDLNSAIESCPSKRIVEVLRGENILTIEINMFNKNDIDLNLNKDFN